MIAVIVLVGGVAFAAGYFFRPTKVESVAVAPDGNKGSQGSYVPPGALAAANPASAPSVMHDGRKLTANELIADYAEILTKPKGGFVDQAEYLAVYQKKDAVKKEMLQLGAAGFDAIIQFIGEAGKVPNGPSDNPNDARAKQRIDPEVREAMIEFMPDLDATRAVKDLSVRLLDDNEGGRVRARSAGLMAHLDRNIAIPALVEALDRATERHWDGERGIVESLTAITGPEAEAALLKALQRRTTEPGTRSAVAQGLGILNSKAALPSLELIVRHESSDHYVRRDAIRAIVHMDKSKALAIIKEQIPKEKDTAFKEFMMDVQRDISR